MGSRRNDSISNSEKAYERMRKDPARGDDPRAGPSDPVERELLFQRSRYAPPLRGFVAQVARMAAIWEKPVRFIGGVVGCMIVARKVQESSLVVRGLLDAEAF